MAEWAFWGCLPFLGAAFITDIRSMRIPNWITVTALLGGLAAQTGMRGWQGFMFAGAGAVAGFAVLLLLHLIGAVGAGDVKLFAGIGAWTGVVFTAQLLMYSILFGAVIGWVIVLRRKNAGNNTRRILGRIAGFMVLRSPGMLKSNDLLKFPFMLAVLPAAICAYLYY